MKEPIIARCSKDLEAIVPRYLARRREEIASLRARLDAGDYKALRIIGHSLKGSGGGYGMPALSDIGARIEKAATRPTRRRSNPCSPSTPITSNGCKSFLRKSGAWRA